MKNITITDLAEELGISPSTVSRALNNSPKISEKRRREINELALKRGFKLRTFTRRTTNLCLLLPITASSSLPSAYLRTSIQTSATAH